MKNFAILIAALLTVLVAGCLEEPPTSGPPGGAADAGFSGDAGGEDDGGETNGGEPDAGSDADQLVEPDADDTDAGDSGGWEDTGPVDPCDGVTCGANASCQGGTCSCATGYEGDPYAGCVAPGPCGSEGCEYGAYCDQGLCRCKFGFTATTDGCDRDGAPDPVTRSKQEVCDMWLGTTHPSAPMWEIEPEETCDWGVLDSVYHNNAMTELNLYRWLVGLEAMASQDNLRETTQACATVLAGEGAGLTHFPDESYTCYTQQGASGAGSSNIAMGTNAVGSVRLYIEDWNVPSLGHRRWAFNPRAVDTAFGARGTYTCMYAFSSGGSHNPEFTAYPAPGYFPAGALAGKWSVASSSWGLNDEVEIEILRLSDQEVIGTHSLTYHQADMLRPHMVSFRPVAPLTREVAHEVRISNLNGSPSEQTYTLTLTDC